MRIVLHTEVNTQCDKLVKVVGRTSTFASTVNLVSHTERLPLSNYVENTSQRSTGRDEISQNAEFETKFQVYFGYARISLEHSVGQIEVNHCAENQLDLSSRFDTVLAVTDRRTDEHMPTAYTAVAQRSVAW